MSKGVDIFSLEGKTALVTGATGHLGMAMAFILAEAGAKVLINSRSHERSEKMVADIHSAGLSAESAAFDVTSPEAVDGFIKKMKGHPLHILINNAYVGGAGNIELSGTEAYTASYDVTMISAHRLLRSLLPNLRKAVQDSNDASVINLASMYALVSPDQRIYDSASSSNPPYYGAAKAALLHWTRYAGCEFGKEGIRVNAISPGPFPSEAVQRSNPAFVSTLSQKVPMGRIGHPGEIKGPILFLASRASSFVNGANIVVDGGWSCW
ncbi:SDR family oxidoreductase [Pseudomonas citronellolis]|uniref:SDR family NAD(P)-dependent oxidoreductase n=1 Tax=Pseudomonas citronellolis TaxID=53408 RepID=UPI00226FE9C4|nr:SDR family oxidoreductase [Pseudomonas citronellolis]WAB92585.1 SDR family oxidoreductase [Pseudomonas citronellolis]